MAIVIATAIEVKNRIGLARVPAMGAGIAGQDKTKQGYSPLCPTHGISPLAFAYSKLERANMLTEVAKYGRRSPIRPNRPPN